MIERPSWTPAGLYGAEFWWTREGHITEMIDFAILCNEIACNEVTTAQPSKCLRGVSNCTPGHSWP